MSSLDPEAISLEGAEFKKRKSQLAILWTPLLLSRQQDPLPDPRGHHLRSLHILFFSQEHARETGLVSVISQSCQQQRSYHSRKMAPASTKGQELFEKGWCFVYCMCIVASLVPPAVLSCSTACMNSTFKCKEQASLDWEKDCSSTSITRESYSERDIKTFKQKEFSPAGSLSICPKWPGLGQGQNQEKRMVCWSQAWNPDPTV